MLRPTLRVPVKEVLVEALDDAARERIWRRLARRARRPAMPALERRPAPWTRRVALGLPLAALVASAAVSGGLNVEQASPQGPSGELGRAEDVDRGSAPVEVAPRVFPLAGRSRLVVMPGAELLAVSDDPEVAAFELVRGAVTFEVQPAPPRRFTVDCGLAVLELVGARLSIARDEGRLLVEVAEGTAEVTGPLVPDGSRLLRGGQSLVIAAPPGERADPGSGRSLRARVEATLRVARDDLGARADRAARSGGGPTESSAPAGAAPEKQEPRGASDLLALSDQARLAGDRRGAAELLEELLEAHPADPSAPVAAFTLATLYLDELDEPARAAAVFERAIAAKLPGALREDALARWATALARSGEHGRAESVARRYLADHPSGHHAEEMRALGGPR